MSTDATLPENSAATASWDAVDRVCRRICLLRATGRSVDAAHLQSTELSRLLTALPPHPATEARLHARFATEEARIADAQLLADFLAPLVAAQLRAASFALPTVASPTAPRPSSPPQTIPAHAGTPPGIADFIDDMLAQERPSSRPLRRAS